MGSEASTSSIVPATSEALLRLILTLEEPEVKPDLSSKTKQKKKTSEEER